MHGNWKLDLGGRKLAAVHTISMTQPTTQSFNQLINQCDESLQTVIVKAAQDEYIYDETDTLMPNIVNIYIGIFIVSLVICLRFNKKEGGGGCTVHSMF